MQGPDALANRFNCPESLKFALQLLHVHKAVAVAEVHGHLPGLGVGEQVLLALFLPSALLDVSQDHAQLQQPFIPVGEELRLLNGPEPQRCPVVHGPLQPQARIGVGHALAGHFLLLNPILLLQGRPGFSGCRGCRFRPHRQGVGGAFAQLGQLMGPGLHQAIHQPAQAFELGNL